MSNRVFTQQEEQAFMQAEAELRKSGLDVDYEGANHNANLIWNYFQQNPTVPATVANIYAVVEQKKNDFVWRTPAQRVWDDASKSLSVADRQKILEYVHQSKNLRSDGDNLFKNAECFARFFAKSNLSVGNCGVALGRMSSSLGYQLVFAKNLQGSEREAQQNREAASALQKSATRTDEVEIPKGLSPHLHEHYRTTHQKPEKKTETVSQSGKNHYTRLAEAAVQSIASNLDRTEAEKLLANIGKWGPELTYRSIINFIAKRQHQRATAAR